ncbi:MAG: ABC transporter ATP-binding protein [Clostridia bacterium]|nr:ABC transporter ATP-binding protein [Clostridia bacterium]
MIAIKTENLTKKFGELVAVDNLNLQIAKGEFYALLGLNGAGKTTAIKMLSCLMLPTSGDAYLLGNSIIKNELKVKEIINLSPQETAIAPNLSVEENLIFIAQIYGMNELQAKLAAKKYINLLKIDDKKNVKAKKLSGGLQRRLSIAMALITQPQILFLDEPTLGLDVRIRKEIRNILKQLKKEVTIILTTQYLDEVEELADRVGIMHYGKLKIEGTIEEIKKFTSTNSFRDAFLSLTEEEL